MNLKTLRITYDRKFLEVLRVTELQLEALRLT